MEGSQGLSSGCLSLCVKIKPIFQVIPTRSLYLTLVLKIAHIFKLMLGRHKIAQFLDYMKLVLRNRIMHQSIALSVPDLCYVWQLLKAIF